MKKVGDVSSIHGGVFVVRSTDVDESVIGSTLYGDDMSEIGEVIELIGLVEEPFTVAEMIDTDVSLGDSVYTR